MGCTIHNHSVVITGRAAQFSSAAPALAPVPDALQIEREPKTKGIENNV